MAELAFNRDVAQTVRTLGVAGVVGAVYFAAVIVTAAREIDPARVRLSPQQTEPPTVPHEYRPGDVRGCGCDSHSC